MVKVMLVDDEPIEREGLKLMLCKNRSNVEVVAEARDGQEAIDFALQYEPDVIFMDIKMTEVDGVTAIKRILQALPETKGIMVTAFDTFQYAQEVMKHGVKEYLLKPSKKSKVLEAFDRMAVEVENIKKEQAEKQKIQDRLERIGSFIESEFIVSLMMDYVYEHSLEEWSEWLNVDEDQGYVIVFSFESKTNRPDRSENLEWYRLLKQLLQEQHRHCLVGPLIGYQVPTFILSKNEGAGTIKEKEERVRAVIHDFHNHFKKGRLKAGIGTVVADLKQFSRSYAEALCSLDAVYTHPSATYMTYHIKLKQKRGEMTLFEKEKELIKAVKYADLPKGLLLFESYFQLLLNVSEHHMQTVIKRMEIFFNVLNREVKELGINEESQTQFQLFRSPVQVKEVAKVYLSSVMN